MIRMNAHDRKYGTVICGAGIVGLTLARELVRKGHKSIAVIEKEDRAGTHASGRNSGVLHAGIYYSSDTFKARFCAQGNAAMKEFCRKKNLALLENGKVIVAKNPGEVPTVVELHRRAVANGAIAKLITEKEMASIEPEAKTCETALHSPGTAVVDPKQVVAAMVEDLASTGKVEFFFDTRVIGLGSGRAVDTGRGKFAFELFINAAGAYSDIIAHSHGVGAEYRLLPFKGTYKKIVPARAGMVKGNIYPVPNIKNPFLGVHFTKNTKGELYLGPTAIPAFARENYGLLAGLNGEFPGILYRDAMLFLLNPQFRSLAFEEPKKYISRYFYRSAKELVRRLEPADIEHAEKVGIRPQLVDWKKKQLVMDFMVVRKENCVHVLNSVSPAFTCSMPFAEHVVREYIL